MPLQVVPGKLVMLERHGTPLALILAVVDEDADGDDIFLALLTAGEVIEKWRASQLVDADDPDAERKLLALAKARKLL